MYLGEGEEQQQDKPIFFEEGLRSKSNSFQAPTAILS